MDEWTSEQVNEIEVFDVYGRKQLSSTCPPAHSSSINISHLPAGIYLVKIVTEQGNVIRKVVKL
jgi:hypothetical protein